MAYMESYMKKTRSLNAERIKLMTELGIASINRCTKDEEDAITEVQKQGYPIPDGIFAKKDGKYYKCTYDEISDAEITKLLTYRVVSYLRIIRTSVIGFGIIVSALLIYIAVILTSGI
jgi:hypothetical protein